jgi:hypothetical protein
MMNKMIQGTHFALVFSCPRLLYDSECSGSTECVVLQAYLLAARVQEFLLIFINIRTAIPDISSLPYLEATMTTF